SILPIIKIEAKPAADVAEQQCPPKMADRHEVLLRWKLNLAGAWAHHGHAAPTHACDRNTWIGGIEIGQHFVSPRFNPSVFGQGHGCRSPQAPRWQGGA